VSASIGISNYSPDNNSKLITVDDFIKQADDAMYAAKNQGKNCYYVWKKEVALNSYRHAA
jgi:PleD family two-component response regulator